MNFLISIGDIQSKNEEETLALFRRIESWGDPQLTIRLLKTLDEYFIEIRDEEMGNPL